MNQWTKEQLEEMFGNNRFDQLAFLSGCQKHRLANDKTIPDGWVISDEVLKKFAQLIVRECIGRISIHANNDEITNEWVYSQLAQDIKQHFEIGDEK